MTDPGGPGGPAYPGRPGEPAYPGEPGAPGNPGAPANPAVPRRRGPGDAAELSSWVQAQLVERRVVLLRGPLDDALAGEVAATLMMLDATGDDAVQLQLDSSGGPFEAAFTVIDTIEALGVPVHVTCVGRAEAAAVGIVAVGARRRAAPHCRFRLGEPTSSVTGSAGQLEHWSNHRQAQLARFVEVLARATGRPGEHVEADLSVGRWLSADEAVAYGLVDELWRPGRDGPPPSPSRPPFGFGPRRG